MRTVLLGLDAFDPGVFERLYNQGRLPNLARYVQSKRYARFQVSNPSQSEVSWTSIASGLNPGQHGIFDFVHRDPRTYGLYVSLLPSRAGVGGLQFARPSAAPTIFDRTADRGFPAASLWWPATFPARPESPVQTLPGLGTPDIQGRLGIGHLFVSDPDRVEKVGKTPVDALERAGKGRYAQALQGPVYKTRQGEQKAGLPFTLDVNAGGPAVLKVGDRSLELQPGVWSPILEFKFKIGMFFSVWAVTRAILTREEPDVRLYFLPLQLHPLKSPWRYGTPSRFIKDVWRSCGPFLTIGWPQDTQALEDGILTGSQFLDLCQQISDSRERLLLHLLEGFREGILGTVFDTLDRVQHMFWKTRPDVVDEWYLKLDALVGRVEDRFARHSSREDRLVIVSDHGFADFDYKVHLNRWLVDGGYLASRDGHRNGEWKDLDWPRTRAYAIGLNGLYLNLAGREAQGLVQPERRQSLLDELVNGLLSWNGPDGKPVVQEVWRNEEAFTGSLAENGPDLVIGYAPGYRASSQTGLGGWEEKPVERNDDHWGADHCINPQAVPGVLFANQDLEDFPSPSYPDIPFLTTGEGPDTGSHPPPPSFLSDEEEQAVQERLKSLGYF